MNKKKNKENTKLKLSSLLPGRIKSLEITRRHYEQNQNLMKNIKVANIELVQNDLATLKKLLSKIAKIN